MAACVRLEWFHRDARDTVPAFSVPVSAAGLSRAERRRVWKLRHCFRSHCAAMMWTCVQCLLLLNNRPEPTDASSLNMEGPQPLRPRSRGRACPVLVLAVMIVLSLLCSRSPLCVVSGACCPAVLLSDTIPPGGMWQSSSMVVSPSGCVIRVDSSIVVPVLMPVVDDDGVVHLSAMLRTDDGHVILAVAQSARVDAVQSFTSTGLVCPSDERAGSASESYSLVVVGTPGLVFQLTLTTPDAQIDSSAFLQGSSQTANDTILRFSVGSSYVRTMFFMGSPRSRGCTRSSSSSSSDEPRVRLRPASPANLCRASSRHTAHGIRSHTHATMCAGRQGCADAVTVASVAAPTTSPAAAATDRPTDAGWRSPSDRSTACRPPAPLWS